MELTNKIVLVTGGSDGIGRHICLKLAEQGCQIAILGRDAERLSAVKEECLSAGAPKASAYACDLCVVADIESTVNDILSEFGALDILINNAGIWPKMSTLDEIDPDFLVTTVQTNLTALMQLTRFVLPGLRNRDAAAILNIASKSGVVAQAGQSVYSATKYGVRGFTDVLKEDERESGVRVAAIYQSGTNTNMFAKANEDVPNRIFTEPGDLADVVVFMLSRPDKIWLHEVRIEI